MKKFDFRSAERTVEAMFVSLFGFSLPQGQFRKSKKKKMTLFTFYKITLLFKCQENTISAPVLRAFLISPPS